MRERSGMRLVLLTAVLLSTTGCASCHIARLSNVGEAHKWDRSAAARALKAYIADTRATDSLIAALSDPDPTVRYFAAESLEDHLIGDTYRGYCGPSAGLLRRACEALICCLDDGACGWIRLHYYWPMGVWGGRATASVRYRAAMTLCVVLHADRGFDAEAWRREVDRVLREREMQRKWAPPHQVPPR